MTAAFGPCRCLGVLCTLAVALATPSISRAQVTIQRAGLTGSPYTGTGGYQFSQVGVSLGVSSQLAGYSTRILDVNTANGRNSWAFDPITGVTTLIGLTGIDYTGLQGYQTSDNAFQNAAGQVIGKSTRYDSLFAENGQDSWFYRPATGLTTQIGLTGAVYTGTAGYQFSDVVSLNAAGQVAGSSTRITGLNSNNGGDTWVFNSTTGVTTQIGYTGAGYTGTDGYQFSLINFQNSAGQITGSSFRIFDVAADNGRDAWIYLPSSSSTVQIGLITGAHMGSNGYRSAFNIAQHENGQVVGYSERYLGVNTVNGLDAWVYSSTTGTVQIGLTGTGYMGSGGLQFTEVSATNEAGYVAGLSYRYTGVDLQLGQNTWAYSTLTGLTTITGLIDSLHTHPNGTQTSSNDLLNDAGQIAGTSVRFDVAGFNGINSWAFDPITGITLQTGFTSSRYTDSQGSQFSANNLQNASGQVAGRSITYRSDNNENGQDTWIYRPSTGTVVRTGLTGAAYTGSQGYQSSANSLMNNAGQVAGISIRVTGVDTVNGQNTWVYHATTGTQFQTGLTSAAHTGSQGYQFSGNSLQNAAGRLVGFSSRISGLDNTIGQDAWYYDPTTHVNTQITAGVAGSVRASDSYAFSTVSVLTESGYALGQYTFFAGNAGAGQDRAFLYRPDIGFQELGSIVSGGLTANGWANLSSVLSSNDFQFLVGNGLALGQSPDSQSVYVINAVPEPGSALLLGVLGMAGAWRVRRHRVAIA